MVTILKPPQSLDTVAERRSIFLAGSIEMGTAADWQSTFSDLASNLSGDAENLVILNPRRESWDASWEQSISNPLFFEQVQWELAAQEMATHIAMYFAPQTQAPITLLELGLFARSGKLTVCCPEGFWRKGNVDIVCARYGVPVVEDLQQLAAHTATACP